jgi:hypothetical protein
MELGESGMKYESLAEHTNLGGTWRALPYSPSP